MNVKHQRNCNKIENMWKIAKKIIRTCMEQFFKTYLEINSSSRRMVANATTSEELLIIKYSLISKLYL